MGQKSQLQAKYDKNFKRAKNGIEKLIYGCSLKALNNLCSDKGYSLVYSNKNGNNAFFVKDDLLNDKIKTIDIDEAFKKNSFKRILTTLNIRIRSQTMTIKKFQL